MLYRRIADPLPHAKALPVPTTMLVRIRMLFGIALAIGLVAAVNRVLIGGTGMPLLITPIGASATLLFGTPKSPIASPWAVIGGSTVSALAAVGVARLVHDQAIASPLAVAAAISIMWALRCFHPPGAAVALAAVVGNAAIRDAGFSFALLPICVDSLLLVVAHRLVGMLTLRTSFRLARVHRGL